MEGLSEETIRKMMKNTFSFDFFKNESQKQSVEAVLRGDKNIVVSMPTNSGKSLCFQLPACFERDNITLVISPNLALIENQMQYLNQSVSLIAESINSNVDYDKRDKIYDMMDVDESIIKFLFVTPEMAVQDYFKSRIEDWLDENVINRIVVDEAHCIIDKDYRDAYSVIKKLRNYKKDVQFIALTTAGLKMMEEIANKIGMKKPTKIKCSSVKDNIYYDAVEIPDETKAAEIDFLSFFKQILPHFDALEPAKMPSIIIYCETNRDVEQVAAKLTEKGIPVAKFYGNYINSFKDYKDWKDNKIPIMVATSESFGLGIYKEFVRFVVHTFMPKNLRAYYQESGRAGAKGEKSYSRIYYRKSEMMRNPEEMGDFCKTKECRRQLMAKHFEEDIEICEEMCDSCEKKKDANASPSKRIKIEDVRNEP